VSEIPDAVDDPNEDAADVAQSDGGLSEHDYRRRTRRSLLTGAGAIAAGALGWRWVQTQPTDDRIPSILRRGHETNEALWSGLFREDHQARTFDRSAASILRINGRIGIRDEIDLDAWRLEVFGPDGTQLDELTLADIEALPFHEMTIEHKCIEGWSQITNWGGARFADFMDRYTDAIGDDIDHVEMATPDEEYYVSVDVPTLRHDQTLLAYRMLDQPLDLPHGAPLRLATPLKYGIKQIKRVGRIQFLTAKGADYWGERGYDWYAGL